MGFLRGLLPGPRKADASPIVTTAAAFSKPPARQHAELGTINYVNLRGTHGDVALALAAAEASGLPILANFVEFPGWQGCKDAGTIFADPAVRRAAEECFVPCAFNTWDRSNPAHNRPMRMWSKGLESSWWGYLRIVSADGQTVLAGTRQLTGAGGLGSVKECMREALRQLGIEIPPYLR